ncbi:MAG: serine/threonine-protein kinase [Planctomycetota bacterium]
MTSVDLNTSQPIDSTDSHTQCRYCAEFGQLREVAPGLQRCQACDFVLPKSRKSPESRHLPDLEALPRIAPGNVLRERYRLVELIGRGAHGLTCFAEHEFLNHPCVVKILPYRVSDASDTAARRLRHEAQVGFRVNNPNVVRILDCDVVEGYWYFVMEYVDGMDLGALIQSGLTVNWQQALRLARDAASGLAAIHRAGLIHRDIKPGNLLLGTDGCLRVSDLGVATLAEGETAFGGDASREAVGTLDYAAPELFEPQAPVDFRADLYSLGATLYHVITGRPPYAGHSVFQMLIDAQSRSVEWPANAPTDVPEWFISTILRLMATEPSERFESTEMLAEVLDRPTAQPTPKVKTPVASRSLRPRGVAVLPFDNDSRESSDDWLGFALADSLTRELSQVPDVYLATHEQFKLVHDRLELDYYPTARARLLAAGRLVGAGTVITGGFNKSGNELSFEAEIQRFGHDQADRLGPLTGPLSRLVELQAELLKAVLKELGLDQVESVTSSGQTADPISLEMREKFTRGKQAYLAGDYGKAIELAQQAVAENPDVLEPIQYMGVCYARLGKYEEAQRQHEQMQEIANKRDDRRLLVEAQANMGVMYYFRGEYETAHNYYAQAAEIAEETGLITERAQVYNNLGFVLFRLGRPEAAEKGFLRAIEIFRDYGALASLIGPYNGMGNVLVEQNRHDEARDYYQRALALAQEVGDVTNVGVSHMHLGRCASVQGRFADAKNEFALALNALEGTSFWNVLARTYAFIAEMNLKLGNVAEAIRCADKNLALAQRHANTRMETAAWRQKAEALERAGRNPEAEICRSQALKVEAAQDNAAP